MPRPFFNYLKVVFIVNAQSKYAFVIRKTKC